MPGGSAMARRFALFQDDLPLLCQRLKLERNELIFNDYTTLIAAPSASKVVHSV
jgi:hypothetical protein